MLRYSLALTFALPFSLLGCHSSTPAAPPSSKDQVAGRSLDDMKAEYAKLRQQYVTDCINGTPEHIQSTRALCEQERQKMDPLGDAIMQAEIKSSQHLNNP